MTVHNRYFDINLKIPCTHLELQTDHHCLGVVEFAIVDSQ